MAILSNIFADDASTAGNADDAQVAPPPADLPGDDGGQAESFGADDAQVAPPPPPVIPGDDFDAGA